MRLFVRHFNQETPRCRAGWRKARMIGSTSEGAGLDIVTRTKPPDQTSSVAYACCRSRPRSRPGIFIFKKSKKTGAACRNDKEKTVLRPVSQTVVDHGPKGPHYSKQYDLSGLADLLDIGKFARGMPHDDFDKLRSLAPVYWHDEPGNGQGCWAVTRYDDIISVSKNSELFSNQIGGHQIAAPPASERHERLWSAALDNMINLDGNAHLKLRVSHMPYFTPTYVSDLRKRVASKITKLLDGIEGRGHCDLVREFSSLFPLFTLSEMLGVPEVDRPKLVEWMEYLEMAQVLILKQLLPEDMVKYADFGVKFVAKMDEMLDYGSFMINARRKDPRADLFTAIANATVDGEHLSPEYISGSWLLIYNAGNDTTRNTISGSVKLFSDNPDQKQLLRDDPSLVRNATEEALRMVSPVIFMRRTATADTEIAGQRIAAGEKVVMWYPSANRDETIFADPHRFDIRRSNSSRQLAFGFGRHVCLGQRVAIMQLEEVFKQLWDRFPDIHVSGDVEIAPNNFVYAIRHMPVSYGTSSGTA